jgi:hypothetical protein
MMSARDPHIKIIAVIMTICGIMLNVKAVQGSTFPFKPGEKLKYVLRWENIPAGELHLETRPITTIGQSPAFHFVLIAKSNSTVDLFCKIRDRIDAYADTKMTRSVFYQKKRGGGKTVRREQTTFDWLNHQTRRTGTGRVQKPIRLVPGSFDPLSALYYTRMAICEDRPQIRRPITDGKNNFIGRIKIVGRETITLHNGKHHDTLVLEPDIKGIGGVFKKQKNANLRIWITADEKRIPVQIKTSVKVGHFIAELVSATGV